MTLIHGSGRNLPDFNIMNNKDSKLIYEAYNEHPLTEGSQSGDAESRYDEPYRKAERNKFNNPHHRQLQKKMQADYDAKKDSGDAESRYDEPYRKDERDKFNNPHHRALQSKMQGDYDAKKDQPPHVEPEYSSKEKERLAGFQTEEDESSVEDIQASRYGGDGNEFDANADLKQEVSDINDLVYAFYSAGEVDPGKHDEVAQAIHSAKKALEGVVGINVDFDVHGKPEGPEEGPASAGLEDPSVNKYL